MNNFRFYVIHEPKGTNIYDLKEICFHIQFYIIHVLQFEISTKYVIGVIHVEDHIDQ